MACVWSAVTVAAGVAAWLAAPLVEPAAWDTRASFADLLVRVSGLVLGGALTWLWVVTTLTVGQLLLGATPSDAGTTRRLVLLACGAALAAGVTQPASATEGADVLEGLRLPERAVAVPAAPPPAAPRSVGPAPAVPPPVESSSPAGGSGRPRLHVVRPGESLWSIAAATAPAEEDVDARWRAIWVANRAVVGTDPDLILPGQRLRIPAQEPAHSTTHDSATHDSTTHDFTQDSTQDPGENTDETGDRP
ncbi:MAG: hypothetical protein AVDCRST_MAG32-1995 [uncultured Nocardioides sp.]|uniref:LysM domain-containing protein n=1 Tax=uncultured Nocardioides sp. TaxID=198441 RepID=A0A6J4NJP5_9ACTN|nr:MAG: hypothetical protein AVDCRST_MAG32-1995 [uncultured Nocardioides sp.]